MGLINDQRASDGLSLLAPHGSLAAAAQAYASLHFARDPYALSHNLDGTPQDRAARVGYYGWIGEVIVTGAVSARTLMDLWMGSPPHAAIIMGDFAEMGVGCQEGPYTTPDGYTFQIALCVGLTGKH